MIVVLFALLLLSNQQKHTFSNASGNITPAQIKAVELAIEDEIYDYRFEEDYIGVGKNEAAPGRKWVSRMLVYVDPRIDEGGGTAINLKHYGEIYRAFYIRDDGVVVLDGDPELEFPPTEVSFKTKYMSRNRLARLKRDWLHESFVIDTDPDIKIVREAASREKDRTDFSYWESEVLPHLSGQ